MRLESSQRHFDPKIDLMSWFLLSSCAAVVVIVVVHVCGFLPDGISFSVAFFMQCVTFFLLLLMVVGAAVAVADVVVFAIVC